MGGGTVLGELLSGGRCPEGELSGGRCPFPILGSTHCCSYRPDKRSQSQRPYHTDTETTALVSHPCPYRLQNLSPHVSRPFWNLSIVHVIHGYAMLCFQVQGTPIIHAWGFCCNSHKSEVWQSCFLSCWT